MKEESGKRFLGMLKWSPTNKRRKVVGLRFFSVYFHNKIFLFLILMLKNNCMHT